MLTAFGRNVARHLAKHHDPFVLHIEVNIRIVLVVFTFLWGDDAISSEHHFGRLDFRRLREDERSPVFV